MQAWQVWIIAALLVPIVFIVSRKALMAQKKRSDIVNRQMSEMKHENFLRDKYRVLDSETVRNAEMPELLEGAATNIQLRLDKIGDLKGAFAELPINEQYIYTLNYLVLDGGEKLSEFFKKNGEPLISLAPQALEAIGSPLAPTVKAMFAMFDKNDEETSYDEERMSEIDEQYKKQLNQEELFSLIKQLIIRHFCDTQTDSYLKDD